MFGVSHPIIYLVSLNLICDIYIIFSVFSRSLDIALSAHEYPAIRYDQITESKSSSGLETNHYSTVTQTVEIWRSNKKNEKMQKKF